MRRVILFVFLMMASTVQAGPLAERAQSIADFLRNYEHTMRSYDQDTVQYRLDAIESILRDYGDIVANPFRLALDGTTLRVYARDTNQLLISWNNHQHMRRVGDVLGLLDSLGEFVAIKYRDGVATRIAENWKDTIDYAMYRDYIGLVDSAGISEVYRVDSGEKVISNWKNTVSHKFEPEFIVLLDNEADRNLEVFDTLGQQIVALKGVTSFQLAGSYMLSYVQNGTTRSVDISAYLH